MLSQEDMGSYVQLNFFIIEYICKIYMQKEKHRALCWGPPGHSILAPSLIQASTYLWAIYVYICVSMQICI